LEQSDPLPLLENGVKKAIVIMLCATLFILFCSMILSKERENETLRMRLQASEWKTEPNGKAKDSSFAGNPLESTGTRDRAHREVLAPFGGHSRAVGGEGGDQAAPEVGDTQSPSQSPLDVAIAQRQVVAVQDLLTTMLRNKGNGSITTMLQVGCGAWTDKHALASYKMSSAGTRLDLVAYTGADPQKAVVTKNHEKYGHLRNVKFIVLDAALAKRLPFRYDLVVLTDYFSGKFLSSLDALETLKRISSSGSKWLLTRSLRRNLMSPLGFNLHGQPFNLEPAQQTVFDGRDTQLEVFQLPLVFNTPGPVSKKAKVRQGNQAVFE
jgi:hypothetical protein